MAAVCLTLGLEGQQAPAPPPQQPYPLAAPAPATPAPATAAPSSAVERPVRVTPLPDVTTTLKSSTRSNSEPLHLLVGRSMFIKTETRLKRVYISNPAAVSSFTSSPTQIVITAREAGISSVILWDELGQSATYVVFADLDVASLAKEIHEALPNDDIKVESQLDRVSLSGTVENNAAVDAAGRLAGLYAKVVVNSVVVRPPHERQVKLQIEIIEIDRSKLDQLGVNLFSQGKNQSNVTTGQFASTQTYTPASGSTAATITPSNPLNLFFFRFGTNVGLSVQDLQSRNVAQILAEPSITTLSGQKASFLAGGEFPFPVVQGSSGGLTSITIQFRPYGVKLDFTPVVNDDGSIALKVAPEVSALDYSNAVTISGYTIPAISTRRAETQVELQDGQSFAISGLLDHRTTDILSKMPGLGDVPILGQLFHSKNINRSTSELMVIATPMIVDPLHDAAAPAKPQMPVPMLDNRQFDQKLSPKPAATGAGGAR